jgi:flagellar basal-body rod modification protein FlgD
MTTVNPLSNIAGGLTPASTTRTPSSDIDQEGFLSLLVAQLQNQDPLEPLSNEEFVSQLTSFSSLDELRSIKSELGGLSGLEDMNTLLQASLSLQQTNVNAASVSLIGKKVEVSSNAVMLGQDGNSEIIVEAPEGSENVSVELKSETGESLYKLTFNPDQLPDGVRLVNGRFYINVPTVNADGEALPNGIAKIVATAETTSGEQTLETSLLGLVEGIDFSGNQTMLTVQGTPIDIVNVLAVNNAS